MHLSSEKQKFPWSQRVTLLSQAKGIKAKGRECQQENKGMVGFKAVCVCLCVWHVKNLHQIRTRFSSLLQEWQNDPRVKVLHL